MGSKKKARGKMSNLKVLAEARQKKLDSLRSEDAFRNKFNIPQGIDDSTRLMLLRFQELWTSVDSQARRIGV
jgi:hypothetical protein